jgi:hypothetical protein
MKLQLAPATNRRDFLRNSSLAFAASAAAGLLAPQAARAVTPALTFADIPGTGDVKVLNYALALEALEADLYAQALMRLTNGGTNALGKNIKGLKLNRNKPDVFYLRQFGRVEQEHRDFINAALGAESLLSKPPFNNAKFDFGIESKSRREVMDLVYTAESIGVGAYLGAIPLFATRTFLEIAGSIQGTEARHTAIMADILNDLFNEDLDVAPPADYFSGRDLPIEPDVVLSTVSGFIVL